ncbi:MAG: hypothetical protein WCA82_11520, partial [Jiangellales bacterium]
MQEARRLGRVGWLVVASLVPLVLATVVGLVLLWPSQQTPQIEAGVLVNATVEAIQACPDLSLEQCALAEVTVTSGPDAGGVFLAGAPVGVGAPVVSVGDAVVLQSNLDAPP